MILIVNVGKNTLDFVGGFGYKMWLIQFCSGLLIVKKTTESKSYEFDCINLMPR